MQEQSSNRQSNFGKTWLVHGQYPSTSLFESARKAPDLRRFSTPFASFKCDKQTGHSLADKPANHETQLRRKEIEKASVQWNMARSNTLQLPTSPYPSSSREEPENRIKHSIVMSQYWLVKQEPTAYSWDQFAADGKTDWTGVRNFQARNNLRSMKLGDPVFYYHSVNGKAVVGIAKVTKEAFRDPTAAEGDWSAVELTAVKPVEPPVTVDQIKKETRLVDMPLLKNSRLSVMKLTKEQYDTILELSKRARSG